MSTTTKTTTASLKAATSLIAASENRPPNAYEEFAKESIVKLKNANLTEKNELQQLNKQLADYLADVKRLEDLNLRLIEQVDHAKQSAIPKPMDKSNLDRALEETRLQLEDVSMGCVKHQVNIEEKEILNQNLGNKIKFYQQEQEVQRQKIKQLQSQFDDIRNQKEYVVRASQMAQDDIAREQQKMEKSDKDLASLVATLKESRTRNKKLEFEIQTLLDELAFSKAIFTEEIAELSKRPHEVLSPVDLTNFYKNELLNAVRQIRQDFHNLNEDQIREYKEHKERELNVVIRQTEDDKILADIARSRLNASADLDIQNSNQLKSGLDSNKDEMYKLQQHNAELIRKLGEFEARYQDIRANNADKLERLTSEIDLLKQQNNSYATDLDYWDRVTRTKLETEIQTYRSILNYQTKVLLNTNLTIPNSGSNKVPATIVGAGAGGGQSQPVSQAEKQKAESIAVLRQVFDYFDADKSGSINSRELDNILRRLNVNLSTESYNELLREFDRDASRDIDFREFCKIMLPVFTGKFEDEELFYAFKTFDMDNSGYITVAELKQILAKIGQHFSDSQIAAMIATVDADSDGRLNFKEFQRLMKSPAISL